jgi:hypothetical protein
VSIAANPEAGVAKTLEMGELAPMGHLTSIKARLKDLIETYGPLALFLYLALFFAVWAGFAAAIRAGIHVPSTGGQAGVWLGAYVATKFTQPLRIGVTLVITPVVARWIGLDPKKGKGQTPLF